MTVNTGATLFHFSCAVNDLDVARKFYGDILGCKEGRRLPGRADFNFFGHHLVVHLSPADVVGNNGGKLQSGKFPLRHFGVVVNMEDFQRILASLEKHNVAFTTGPHVSQKGTAREQTQVTMSDGCGNAIEFKGLRSITDVYATPEWATEATT